MYRIKADTKRRRVTTTFEAEFEDDSDEFDNALKAAILEARGDGTSFDILADFTKAPVMPQSRTENAAELMAWCVAKGLRKSANVMGTTLQKIQVRRLAEQDERFGYFETFAEAERWLAD